MSIGDRLPAITLVDQDGQRVRLDALGNRDVLLSFVSTSQAAPTFCPAVTAKFLYLQQHRRFDGDLLVQISRDPSSESPQHLRRYADQFGAHTADWRFLTGNPAEVSRLIASLGAGKYANAYGNEKLYDVSGRGQLLGVLPADDWSPADAIEWAAAIERARHDDTSTYAGYGATAGARSLHANLELHGRGLKRRLDLIEFDKSPHAPIRTFETDMTKLLHLIVVSDDLRDFQHVHPALDPDGHFRLDISFPRPAIYHFYADATPQGRGQGVFRFDATIGEGHFFARPSIASADATRVGPYTVRLSTVRVSARQDVPLLIALQQSGLPAMDLHPFLGAYAHIIAVGISDLSYMHAHPMAPGAMDMGNTGAMGAPLSDGAPVPSTMVVHFTFPRPGLYKLWVQFRGGSALYAAPFVVQAT